ncbi:MBL fold metallo-hydrolase [Bacillus sp. FJAT-49736]|uniref:MBL fold metallo-hydrolase n=1 Tax=Bacillus sp. FJAT-49736 TaxID=2833582 RepID=UPI001BC92F6E|nr:MBL fold metallo-hydrolase [Bacillus sp. FJAT-49736]MBS4175076.1 MBL fold metallo-hydrolase [Bacillus sp. FJAT-49736]
MLFKKDFIQQTVNGVRLGNGTIAFRGFKLNVHCFFVDGILIDTGAKSLEKYFKEFFKQLVIDKVVITHFHEDHTGCAAYLQKKLQLPIFMNDIMIEYCTKMADYPIYRQLFWGRRKPFRAEPISNTFQSPNATWRVIHSPGHAIDHIAFLNEETGQLFTGDLYCQERTKVVLREESIPMIIASLNKILTYDFEDVFCSHAGYLINGRTALKQKLDYLLDLQGNVLSMYEEGMTSEEINAILFPKKYPITNFSSGEWGSTHIIHSIIKHHNKITN